MATSEFDPKEWADEIIEDVNDGFYDDHLVELYNAFAMRQRAVRDAKAIKNRAALKIGDKVRIVGDIRPAYLIGLTGKVVGFARTKISVQFDNPSLARRYGSVPSVRVPAICLDKIEDNVVPMRGKRTRKPAPGRKIGTRGVRKQTTRKGRR